MCQCMIGLAGNDVSHDVSEKVVLFLRGSGFKMPLASVFEWIDVFHARTRVLTCHEADPRF